MGNSRGELPPDVYGGDVILDTDGRGIVVNGIEGRVHLFWGRNEGRSFEPKQAQLLARQLIECAVLMVKTGHVHSDEETMALARAATAAREAAEEAARAVTAAQVAAAESVTLREAIDGAAWARRHVREAWERGK